jgi:hypothetical protein
MGTLDGISNIKNLRAGQVKLSAQISHKLLNFFSIIFVLSVLLILPWVIFWAETCVTESLSGFKEEDLFMFFLKFIMV